MATYKSFTYNLVGDPAPWGAIENQLDKDIIDTLVLDCLTVGKDAVNGHRHIRFYDGSGNTVIFSSGTDLHLDASLCVIESETQVTDGVNTLSLSIESTKTIIDSDLVDLHLSSSSNDGIIIDISGNTEILGTLTLSTVVDASADTNKFGVINGSDQFNYRTGAELLSDLSGDAGATFDWNSQSLTGINDLGCTTASISSLTSGYVPYDNSGVLADTVMYTDGTKIGVNTSNPIAAFDISDGTLSLMVGADNNAITRTINTTKKGIITCPNYAYAGTDNLGIGFYNSNSNSQIFIGGGIGGYYTATSVKIYTGANTTTLLGTLAVEIDNSQNVLIPSNSTYLKFGASGDMGIAFDGTKGIIDTTLVSSADLYINSAKVGIGKVPDELLHIYKASAPAFEIEDSSSSLVLTIESSGALIDSEDLDLRLKAPSGNAVKVDTASFFGLPVKDSTGDPASPDEGYIYVNTSDNAVRLYADSTWRSVYTW